MNIKTLDQLEDQYIGPEGSPEREQYQQELNEMRIGMMIRQARLHRDMTQEELAERIGRKRAFISRLETCQTNLTLRTLRDIVEQGLGAKLSIGIEL